MDSCICGQEAKKNCHNWLQYQSSPRVTLPLPHRWFRWTWGKNFWWPPALHCVFGCTQGLLLRPLWTPLCLLCLWPQVNSPPIWLWRMIMFMSPEIMIFSPRPLLGSGFRIIISQNFFYWLNADSCGMGELPFSIKLYFTLSSVLTKYVFILSMKPIARVVGTDLHLTSGLGFTLHQAMLVLPAMVHPSIVGDRFKWSS